MWSQRGRYRMGFERPFRLRLIHFNDLHGRLADVSPAGAQPVFSRIAGFIRRAREECAGRSDMGVLVLSGGDDLVGSPFAELAGSRPDQFRCHPSFRLYSAAGVDAGAIGNHDLDWGVYMLSHAAARDATFPLLSANLIPAPWAASSGISPFAVVSVNGLRVGVIGVTTPSEIKHLVPDEFEISDPVAVVLDLLPRVREQADAVIVLSHLGRSVADSTGMVSGAGDIELAAALPYGTVPVIVGSHTHDVLNERGLDPANVVNGVTIVQAGTQGRYLGEVLVDVTAEGARVVDARLWPVDRLAEDAEFEANHLGPLLEPVRRLLEEPVGVVGLHPDLDPQHVRAGFASGESALANFVADAVAARCRAAGPQVDFAMVDVSSLSDGLPQGRTLTFGDLFQLAPYADSIVLLRLPFDQLRALLDDNARRADLSGEPDEERGFVHFSREVRYRIGTRGGELAERSDLYAAGITLGGLAPVHLAAARTAPLLVACSSFLRQFALPWERQARERGVALYDLDALPHEVTGLALREELVAYVRQMGGVTEATGLVRDGRVLRVGTGGLRRD